MFPFAGFARSRLDQLAKTRQGFLQPRCFCHQMAVVNPITSLTDESEPDDEPPRKARRTNEKAREPKSKAQAKGKSKSKAKAKAKTQAKAWCVVVALLLNFVSIEHLNNVLPWVVDCQSRICDRILKKKLHSHHIQNSSA